MKYFRKKVTPEFGKGKLHSIIACSKFTFSSYYAFQRGLANYNNIRPRDYKTFFMLNSAEHEVYHAHKC